MIYDLVCSLDTPEIAAQRGISCDEYIKKIEERMSDDKTKEGIKTFLTYNPQGYLLDPLLYNNQRIIPTVKDSEEFLFAL